MYFVGSLALAVTCYAGPASIDTLIIVPIYCSLCKTLCIGEVDKDKLIQFKMFAVVQLFRRFLCLSSLPSWFPDISLIFFCQTLVFKSTLYSFREDGTVNKVVACFHLPVDCSVCCMILIHFGEIKLSTSWQGRSYYLN